MTLLTRAGHRTFIVGELNPVHGSTFTYMTAVLRCNLMAFLKERLTVTCRIPCVFLFSGSDTQFQLGE
jgi:hypothetical protein